MSWRWSRSPRCPSSVASPWSHAGDPCGAPGGNFKKPENSFGPPPRTFESGRRRARRASRSRVRSHFFAHASRLEQARPRPRRTVRDPARVALAKTPRSRARVDSRLLGTSEKEPPTAALSLSSVRDGADPSRWRRTTLLGEAGWPPAPRARTRRRTGASPTSTWRSSTPTSPPLRYVARARGARRSASSRDGSKSHPRLSPRPDPGSRVPGPAPGLGPRLPSPRALAHRLPSPPPRSRRR